MSDFVQVNGVARPTTNSLGQPIHSDPEGILNFWHWFGDSKAVDDRGRPIVTYHGTGTSFSKVNLRKGAQGVFWVTSDLASIEAGEAGAQERGKVIPLYVKLEQPADWDQYAKLMLMEFRSRGLDGAILPKGNGHFDAFIMDPKQVKSAVRNSGAFDPDSSSLFDRNRSMAKRLKL